MSFGISTWLRSLLSLGAFALVLLPGCRNEDPEALLVSARAYQDKGDHKAALIQLKNAVQLRPERGDARLMLGRASLQVGDPATAEKELRKALEYGQSPDAVLPQLAQAMLLEGQAAKLVSEFGERKLADQTADSAFRATLGQAQLQLGKLDEGTASLIAALEQDPNNVPAQLGLARLLAVRGGLDEALAAVDRTVSAHPGSIDALLLQADLRLARGDRAGAKASLELAKAADPKSLLAYLALVQVLIDGRELDAAAKQLDEARKLNSADLRLQFFDALIALGKNDVTRARDALQPVLKRAPDHVPTLVIAGAVELRSGNSAAAEQYLRKAVTLAPQHAGARRLLVRTYLSANQPARALEALQPLIAPGTRADAQLLLLAGETYLANGDLRQATTYYSAASASKGEESVARTRLGQIALARGEMELGVKELEAAVAIEGAPIQAEMSLIVGHLRRNDMDRALAAANEFVRKHPQNPVAQQLRGAVLAARKDTLGAREAFAKALELNPTYLPAAAALARLDIADNKPADARKRFEAVAAKDPKNELALLALAEVLARTGAPASEVAATLQRAVAVNPQSVSARLALIGFHLRAKDAPAALAAAQEADAAVRNDMRIMNALAQAQVEAGEMNQAVGTYNRMAALDPQSSVPLVRLAAAYARKQDYTKAIETLRRAQKITPAAPAIGRDLVLGYLLAGKGDDALKEARALQTNAPKVAVGYLLEGDIYATTKRWPQAESAYRNGLKVDPASETLALKLHSSLLAQKRKAEADALAKKWLSEHPKSIAFRNYLADHALRDNDLRTAVALYQGVIAQEPDNVVALNNLAWAAGKLGDPKAIGYAERAVKLAPDSAPALDTLGVLLVQKGDTAKGLEYLVRATSLAPDRHDIRFNYAKALVKAGRAAEARKQLTTLQGVTADFPGKAEIPALLKQI